MSRNKKDRIFLKENTVLKIYWQLFFQTEKIRKRCQNIHKALIKKKKIKKLLLYIFKKSCLAFRVFFHFHGEMTG